MTDYAGIDRLIEKAIAANEVAEVESRRFERERKSAKLSEQAWVEQLGKVANRRAQLATEAEDRLLAMLRAIADINAKHYPDHD